MIMIFQKKIDKSKIVSYWITENILNRFFFKSLPFKILKKDHTTQRLKNIIADIDQTINNYYTKLINEYNGDSSQQ